MKTISQDISMNEIHDGLEDDVETSPGEVVSTWALIASLISVISIAHPMLWVLPPLAIVLAIVAIVMLRRSETRRGYWKAYIALALSALFGGWGPTQFLSRQIVFRNQADEVCEYFFRLIRLDRLPDAHQMHDERYLNADLNEPMQERYSKDEAALRDMFAFFAKPPLKQLAEAKGDFSTKWVASYNHEADFNEGSETIWMYYDVTIKNGDKTEVVPIRIIAERRGTSIHGKPRWHIKKITQRNST